MATFLFKNKSRESLVKIVETSYNVSEVYPILLELVFNEISFNQSSIKVEGLKIIKDIYYKAYCNINHQNKMIIYGLLKKIRDEKMYEIFENKDTAKVLNRICIYHYDWINDISNIKKTSRNPYKQVGGLATQLFCKHPLPNFLYNSLYKEGDREFKWFLHLGKGKSAKDLPGLYFGWTKRMAHEFMNIKESNIDVIDAIIISVSKVYGGEHGLFPYLYEINKIREGIINSKIGISEFWCQFIEYFSNQAMFNPEEISHIADYVEYIKFTATKNGKPEKPNFDIRKKNIGVLLDEANEWTAQLNRIVRAAGLVRQREINTDMARRQVVLLSTSWTPSGIGKNWKYEKKVKVGKHTEVINYKMIELCNGKELLEEGRALNHCVYSYVKSCSSGSCRIFSLRVNGFGSQLTIEVRGNNVVQVRGKGNRRATDEEVKILLNWASGAGLCYSTR